LKSFREDVTQKD